MKEALTSLCFLIMCVSLTKALNATNATNASIPTNSSSNATQLTTLYIGALFDLSIKSGYGSLPMAEQAIEEINNNTELLPGYRLELVVKSTQGNLGIGQKVLSDFLSTGPRKIMLLGPAENALAMSVAAYSGIPEVNLLQFSYGTNDLNLANKRNLYPNFFRTTTSTASLDEPRIKLIKEYGWDEVGIIYGDSVQYLKLSNQLADRLRQNKIKVLAEVRLQDNDPKRAIRTVKDKGIHVILGMFSLSSVARKMICEAYREGMYGPHYVWIILDSQNNNWWLPRKNEYSACSDVEMKCQIQNHFAVYHTKLINSKGRFYKYANKNGSQIIDDYKARVDTHNDTSNRSDAYLNVYDAVWSIAFVLDKSRTVLLQQGKTLENLTYGDANATKVFRKMAEELDFWTPNIGKRVRYYANGNRKNHIAMKQLVIKDGKFKTVSGGKFDENTNAFTASSDVHWFAGTPYTKTKETYIYRTIDRTLFIILVVFAVFGIVYALFCLLTLVLNYKKKIVKNSGPVISLLIILGCILNYITVILYGFDYSRVSTDQVTRLCRARSWTFAIGFTLSVGGLAAKLWMAYCVLKERFVRSRNVMMFWMLGLLAFLFIIDVIILSCWETQDPLHRALKQVRSQPEYKCFEPITADTFRAEIEVVEHCDCADLTLWLVVILSFKVLLLITGGFLAWQTRRLYIPALNDTQHCVYCMFVVILFCVVGVTVALAATMYPSVYYGVIGVLIIFATTMILLLLLTNKIVRLSCKRKRIKTVRSADSSSDNTTCACGAICAKFCSWCACSGACCISCCSCFPCCNLFSSLRSFFCGSQVHPTSSARRETKSDFYIGGVLQDKDAEIVYLKNELLQKETLLSNLGQNRTFKSNATQTVDDGSSFWSHDDEDSMFDGSGSDAESVTSSDGKRRFRRAARKIRIFNESVDYSHVKSKVNTGLTGSRRSSLSPNSPQSRRNSRMSISSYSNDDLRRMKTSIAEKDDEISRLRKQLEALKEREHAGNLLLGQELTTSPTSQRILLIETPATPIPEEETELVTSADKLPVSSSPSKPKGTDTKTSINNEIKYTSGKSATNQEEENEFVISGNQLPVTPSSSQPKVDANDTSTGSQTEPTSGEHQTAAKTQEKAKKKNSVGPGGAWLFDNQSESTTEDSKAGKPGKKTSVGSTGSRRSVDKKDTSGDGNTTPRTKHIPDGYEKDTFGDDNITPGTKHIPDESVKASLADVSLSVNQENKASLKNTGQDKIRKDSKEKKEDTDGEVSSWLFGNGKNKDKSESSIQEDKNGKKIDDNVDNENGKDKKNISESIVPDSRNVKDESTERDNTANEVNSEENDAATKGSGNEVEEGDDRRNIEMINEEDEDNDDDDDDDYGDGDEDDEDDDPDPDEGKKAAAMDATGSSRGPGKARGRRRKKIGYGKLKWNAASKVDTGSSSYTPRKSVKKIPNFKNDYSHVRSRLSTLSETNAGSDKATENAPSQRQRSVSISKNPMPDFSNVRPRLYDGGKRYYSEIHSIATKTQQSTL